MTTHKNKWNTYEITYENNYEHVWNIWNKYLTTKQIYKIWNTYEQHTTTHENTWNIIIIWHIRQTYETYAQLTYQNNMKKKNENIWTTT